MGTPPQKLDKRALRKTPHPAVFARRAAARWCCTRHPAEPGSAEARRACSPQNTASCGFCSAGSRPLVLRSASCRAGIGKSSTSLLSAKHRILRFLLGGHPPAGAALGILPSRDRQKLDELALRKTPHPAVFARRAAARWCCTRHPAEPGSAEARRAWRISHFQDACGAGDGRAKSSREETSAVPAVIAPCCRYVRCEQRSWSRPRHRSAAGSTSRGVIARRGPARRDARRAAVPSPP